MYIERMESLFSKAKETDKDFNIKNYMWQLGADVIIAIEPYAKNNDSDIFKIPVNPDINNRTVIYLWKNSQILLLN